MGATFRHGYCTDSEAPFERNRSRHDGHARDACNGLTKGGCDGLDITPAPREALRLRERSSRTARTRHAWTSPAASPARGVVGAVALQSQCESAVREAAQRQRCTAGSDRRSPQHENRNAAANHAPSPPAAPAAQRPADNPPAPTTEAPRRSPPSRTDGAPGTHPATAHASRDTSSHDNGHAADAIAAVAHASAPHATARSPSPPTPTRQSGQQNRPAARSASTAARSSATMSPMSSFGHHRPPRPTAPRFRRGGPQTTGSPPSCRPQPEAPTPVTTQRDAESPAITTQRDAKHPGLPAIRAVAARPPVTRRRSTAWPACVW